MPYLPSGLLYFDVVLLLTGILAGAYLPLLSPMTIHYFGLAKVGAGFGLCTFFMGVFLIPLPLAMSKSHLIHGSLPHTSTPRHE